MPAKQKIDKVNKIMNIISRSDVIGVANISRIPSHQMQQIRKSLHDKCEILVSKNSLISIALKNMRDQKPNIDKLIDELGTDQNAVVVSALNPYKLFRELEKTKTKSPARGGEISSEDIIIRKGNTPFKPGPIISELQRAGLSVAIEGGKIVVKKDKVLVSAGQKIPKDICPLLTKFEIFPVTVGLNLKAVYDDGLVFKRNVLDISVESEINKIRSAISKSVHLSMKIGYVTDLTIKPLIQHAHLTCVNLSVWLCIPTNQTIKFLISKAVNVATKLETEIERKKKTRKGEGG
jgi:large subunit ribosomal protein L10